jgi:hypothetical protein
MPKKIRRRLCRCMLQAAKMDSVYANQVKFIQEGIQKFEAAGQKQYVGELRLALYSLKPDPNPAELIIDWYSVLPGRPVPACR